MFGTVRRLGQAAGRIGWGLHAQETLLNRALGRVPRRTAGGGNAVPPGRFRRTREEYAALFAGGTSPHTREQFWLDAARDLSWVEEPTVALDGANPPFFKWFPDGVLNTCFNAVDRQVEAGRGDQVALAYHSTVGGRSRNITYSSLLADVSRFAGKMQELGVMAGDRVVIYMPMIPEAAVAMLACARIGAVHSVVFGGFAPNELAVRIRDSAPKLVIAASCGLEGTKGALPYMPLVNEAIDTAGVTVPHVIVKRRDEPAAASVPYDLRAGRDLDFDACVDTGIAVPCVPLSANAPLYSIYTSGTTGDPKGILRDNTHAVMLQWTLKEFFTTDPGETMFSASDIGWVVGHSYIVYGPLIHGATSIMFEGKPVGTPDAGTFWRIIEQTKATTLFTAPTALRAIRKEDPNGDFLRGVDMSSLRSLFVAGERADPGTVEHFEQLLGVPVVDHWWQTESGSPMCGFQYDDTKTVPGSCALPVPGFDIRVLDPATGSPQPPNVSGSIAIKLPLPPGFMPTLFNNDARFGEVYMAEFPGWYSAGDAGFTDDDGYVHIMTRTDDVINVAGHRLSSGLLEEACLAHPAVVECAVVGTNDSVKGTVPVALLVTSSAAENVDQIAEEVVQIVRERIGAVAALRMAAVVPALPKTRSGKILRNVLRKISNNEPYKLPGTIEDASVVEFAVAALNKLSLGEQRTE